jgi:signal transduction histidine kinase
MSGSANDVIRSSRQSAPCKLGGSGGEQLHSLIARERREILRSCLRKLRPGHPDADGPRMMAALTRFLDDFVQALRADTRDSQSKFEQDERHCAARPEPVPLIGNYGLVGDAISEVAAKRGVVASWRELQVLRRCVNQATAAAVEQQIALVRTRWQRESSAHFSALVPDLEDALASASTAFEKFRRGMTAPARSTVDLVARSLDALGDLIRQQLGEVCTPTAATAATSAVPLATLLNQVRAAAVVRRRVRLVVDVDSSLVFAGDQRLFTSAVTNLIQNAVKFTRSKSTVVVRGREESGQLVVEVEDRCGGLPEGKVDDLFTPFVQKSSDRSGAGLGLMITRRAALALGGTVAARDLPGRGCIFRLELPAGEVGLPPPRSWPFALSTD